MKTIFCIIAESGAGKDTIVEHLHKHGYKSVISYTTRPRRDSEGNTHIFITPEEVKQFKSNIAAYTNIAGFEYFTTIDQLKLIDIYVIDPKGYKYLKDKIKDIKFVPIYISVDEQDRFGRALNRGDKKEVIEKRFISEHKQFQTFKSKEVFYSVPNYDTDNAVQIILEIMDVEGCEWDE